MTPERKKYLASISKEERAIRETIEFHNMNIADEKFYINYYAKIKSKSDKYIILAKEKIVKNKAIIKALKKQLPANKEQYLHWVDYCPNCLEKISNEANYCQNCGRQLFQYVCPICKVSTEFRQDYCCKCGQKLR